MGADDGGVSVDLAPGISAAFVIETNDGRIRVSNEGRVLSRDNHRVTGEIGDARGRIRIETEDGDVALR